MRVLRKLLGWSLLAVFFVGVLALGAAVFAPGWVLCYLDSPEDYVPGSAGWEKKREELAAAARRGQAIIDAIRAYGKDRQRLPESLADLVPAYLPRIPSTGLAHPEFEFDVPDPRRSTLVWYDLGGVEGQATLVITLDLSDRVSEAWVWPVSREAGALAFDPGAWSRREGRIRMAGDVVDRVLVEGTAFDDVRSALGDPVLVDRRWPPDYDWELRIDCSWSWVNFDVFFYWPSEEYPDFIYSGVTERIGRWCYVHE